MGDRELTAALGSAMLVWSSLDRLDRAAHHAARVALSHDLALLKAGARRRAGNALTTLGVTAGVAVLAWAAVAMRRERSRTMQAIDSSRSGDLAIPVGPVVGLARSREGPSLPQPRA